MIVVEAMGVNDALREGLELIQRRGVPRPSRNGPVLEVPEPVTTAYSRPTERVLFSPARDANPFFHLFEALWMLEGRRDVRFPQTLVKRMANYSDDGVNFHGAYGFRWRGFFGDDQIKAIITILRSDPDSRRAVLTMWDPLSDLGHGFSKDLPCNTHVYFKLRTADRQPTFTTRKQLDMTVCNRSNDMVWGAYGANAVHMSMLQEYIANKLEADVGLYHQVSDSFHVYLEGPGGDLYRKLITRYDADRDVLGRYARTSKEMSAGYPSPFGLGAKDAEWDLDLHDFFERWDSSINPATTTYRTPWWNTVAVPMWWAWYNRSPDAVLECAATDWRKAGYEWLVRHPSKEA